MKKKDSIRELLNKLDNFCENKFNSDQNFWQLFHQHQKIIENETLECLLILNRRYEDVLLLARKGEFGDAIKKLNEANSLKNNFIFDEDAAAIFKIISYPNIAYLQFKMNNIRSAQYYTKRTINLIKHRYQDPIFMFRIIQQEVNYATLYFATNAVEKGINYSLKSIIDCSEIIDNCIKNKNYYENHMDDTILLYNTNLNIFANKLSSEIKKNEDKISSSNIINWKLVKNVTDLMAF